MSYADGDELVCGECGQDVEIRDGRTLPHRVGKYDLRTCPRSGDPPVTREQQQESARGLFARLAHEGKFEGPRPEATDAIRMWVLARPRNIHALMRRFPWCAVVRPKADGHWIGPGRVMGYFEGNGIHVADARGAQHLVEPDTLELVDLGPMADAWDAWLDEAERAP